MHIQYKGREYRVEERLPNRDLRLKDIALDESRPVPEKELVESLFEGHLEFLGDSSVTVTEREMAKHLVDDFNMIEDDDPRKVEARRRLAYMTGIDGANLSSFTRATLKPLIKRVHAEIKDTKKAPHWKTVYYGWYMSFIVSGRDIRALVPNYKRRGNTGPKCVGKLKDDEKFSEKERELALEVDDIVHDVIKEEYLNEQRLSVQEVWDKLDGRIADVNRFRDPDDQLPIPHKSSLYKRIKNLDEYEKDSARYGKRFADHKHRCVKPSPQPTRPLERVEFDHTKLDLIVVDEETRLPIGRPTISTAIDKRTREPLGLYVGFDPPSCLSLMHCLHHAIMPKTYVKKLYPRVQNLWEAYGIPETIVVDNGREFYSRAFEEACLQMGIVVQYSPPYMPRYKASIERFFGTQNKQLLHQQPGTTFSNIIDRKDYDPKKNAIISYDAFQEMLHVWIVDIYQYSTHRGLRDIPALVWREETKKFPPALPRRLEDLRILLGNIEHRVIGPSGIELFTLYYNDESLSSLRRQLKGDKKVKVKYDPADLSMVYAYDERADKYIPVPAMDQKYTRGLSLWQHKVVTRYTREELHLKVNKDSLRLAKKRIQEIVEHEWLKSSKTGARAKSARWLGIRQPDYNGALEVKDQQAENNSLESDSKKNVLWLAQGKAQSQGVSDVGNALNHESEVDQSDDGAQPATGVLEFAETKSNSKNRTPKKAKRPAKKAGSSPQKSSSASKGKAEPDPVQEDDELDITGFKANYNLPKKEAV